MLSNRLQAIPPSSGEALDPSEICRIGVTKLSKIVADWCATDVALRERLRAQLALAPPAQAGHQASPTTASGGGFGEF